MNGMEHLHVRICGGLRLWQCRNGFAEYVERHGEALRVELPHAMQGVGEVVARDVAARDFVDQCARRPGDGARHQCVEKLHVSIQDERRQPVFPFPAWLRGNRNGREKPDAGPVKRASTGGVAIACAKERQGGSSRGGRSVHQWRPGSAVHAFFSVGLRDVRSQRGEVPGAHEPTDPTASAPRFPRWPAGQSLRKART